MKTYWTTEHYPNAVPIDFYELVKALELQCNEGKKLTKEGIKNRIDHYTQHGVDIDAYRFYTTKDVKTNYIEVGIRFSDEDSYFFSPLLQKKYAKQFKLDPLNKD
jgi:hypothetical protein|tara:strand:+ start:247 stop:561 length:315 start_codon:yes stop_codon:yes gene_type:complete